MPRLVLALLFGLWVARNTAAAGSPVPEVDGEWWAIASNPDLGPLTTPRQQPVDFAVWQAADGTWQVWSCIRNTNVPGKSRLFYRWEGKNLTDRDWEPKGVAMEADPARGETPGGLQAPFVLKVGDSYQMLYGDWENICLATSRDGKTFERADKPALFTEVLGAHSRDPMVIRIGERWHCYYSATLYEQGAVYCRTSTDLKTWSESKTVAFGGKAGTGRFTAECPFVVRYRDDYYLFRTQQYGRDAQTLVYRSKDPMDFGINQDHKYLVGSLSVAAPEIVVVDGQHYIAALKPDLNGIQIAKLRWKINESGEKGGQE